MKVGIDDNAKRGENALVILRTLTGLEAAAQKYKGAPAAGGDEDHGKRTTMLYATEEEEDHKFLHQVRMGENEKDDGVVISHQRALRVTARPGDSALPFLHQVGMGRRKRGWRGSSERVACGRRGAPSRPHSAHTRPHVRPNVRPSLLIHPPSQRLPVPSL